MNERVGLIIVDYKGEKETLACLDSLTQAKKEEQFAVYVVVVQNEAPRIRAHRIQPTIISLDENLGFAGVNNVGIRRALADGIDQVVLLNNDTTVNLGFLAPLSTHLRNSRVGMVSPKIYFSQGREFHHDEYGDSERGKVIWYAGGVIDWKNVYSWHWGVNEVDHGQFIETVETDFATGCCLAVSHRTIKKIGLMDERYFLYLEDVDWSVRAKKAGLKVVFEPRSMIWHKNAGSTGGPGSNTHVYYQTRNRLLFAQKFSNIRTKMAVYRESLNKRRFGTEIEKKAIVDAWLHRWGKRKL